MLIRFSKENDLIGCGMDPQPIRLQMRAGVCTQGCVHRGVGAGVCMQGCVHRGVGAGVCMQGCVHRGVGAGVCMQGCARRGEDDIRTRASMCNSYTLQYFTANSINN